MKQKRQREPGPAARRPVWDRILKNKHGRIRAALVLLMACALFALCVPFAAWLYWMGFNALMKLWGVTSRNIARAPWFVRQLTRFSGVILTVIQSLLLLVLSRRVACWRGLAIERTPRPAAWRDGLHGAAIGALSLLGLWLLLLAAGNMRLGRSLLRPQWSVNALALPLTIALSATAYLSWGVGLIFRFVKARLPWQAAVAVSALLLAPALLDSTEIDALLAVNLLLCGAVCSISAQKTGSWAWSLGFLGAVWMLERAVLGFPGYTAALYETYPVNYYWLSGGEKGLWHGAAMTLFMLCHAALLLRPLRRKSSS